MTNVSAHFNTLALLAPAKYINIKLRIRYLGDEVVQWLVRRTWNLKVESSSSGCCVYVVLLDKTHNSHSVFLLPLRCINGNLQQIA